MGHLKLSIITPVLNGERFLEQTLLSVLNQAGDFQVEHIVIDGGSTDRTQQILAEFAKKVESGHLTGGAASYTFSWKIDRSPGMYAAINCGFSQATGDIFAWINADDIYQPSAFTTVSNVFLKFSEVQWIKGRTSYIDADSRIISRGRTLFYDQTWIQAGVYGWGAYFIQQDSVFWRKDLWRKVGEIPPQFKLAGDYWLWTQFARWACLWTIDFNLSSFRQVENQLSQNNTAYAREQAQAVPTPPLTKKIVTFSKLERRLPLFFVQRLYRLWFPKHRFPWVHLSSQGTLSLRESKSFALN